MPNPWQAEIYRFFLYPLFSFCIGWFSKSLEIALAVGLSMCAAILIAASLGIFLPLLCCFGDSSSRIRTKNCCTNGTPAFGARPVKRTIQNYILNYDQFFPKNLPLLIADINLPEKILVSFVIT